MAQLNVEMKYRLELEVDEFLLICRLLRGLTFRDDEERTEAKLLADDMARARIAQVEQYHNEMQKLKKNLED